MARSWRLDAWLVPGCYSGPCNQRIGCAIVLVRGLRNRAIYVSCCGWVGEWPELDREDHAGRPEQPESGWLSQRSGPVCLPKAVAGGSWRILLLDQPLAKLGNVEVLVIGGSAGHRALTETCARYRRGPGFQNSTICANVPGFLGILWRAFFFRNDYRRSAHHVR
jgi:hypothetical protein